MSLENNFIEILPAVPSVLLGPFFLGNSVLLKWSLWREKQQGERSKAVASTPPTPAGQTLDWSPLPWHKTTKQHHLYQHHMGRLTGDSC